MAMSVESVGVEAVVLPRPNGLLLFLAGGPNIDPFKRINPATDDLWIRLEPTGQRAQLGPRVEFVTHPSPSTTGANPLPIAHSTVLHGHTVLAFKLLEAQAVVDLVVLQVPQPNDACNRPVHLFAFIEPPCYDWDRYRTLCAQFQPERR